MRRWTPELQQQAEAVAEQAIREHEAESVASMCAAEDAGAPMDWDFIADWNAHARAAFAARVLAAIRRAYESGEL
jgi:hypothetical protein